MNTLESSPLSPLVQFDVSSAQPRRYRRSKLKPSHILRKLYSAAMNVTKNQLGLAIDMSYITDNIVVSSYPVVTFPKVMYRNKLSDLIQYLDYRHGVSNWKIYNLKVELGPADYKDEDLWSEVNQRRAHVEEWQNKLGVGNLSMDQNEEVASETERKIPVNPGIIKDIVVRTGWLDHCPPPFVVLQDIIRDMHSFLDESPSNVVVVHCKMGKGRSGTVVSAYLMKYKLYSFEMAMESFGTGRFKHGISKGVTIQSQLRYLMYHETFLTLSQETQERFLCSMRLQETFRITSIKLIKPFLLLGKGIFSYSIKFQKYNPRRTGLIDMEEIRINRDEFPTEPVDSNILSFPITVTSPDIRIQFLMHPKAIGNTSIEFPNLLDPCLWLNLPCESLKLRGEFNDLAADGPVVISAAWEQLDGANGTANKGMKLFEAIALEVSNV
ncbi:putative phosphatidylinositol-3,4,5-trisphosphate 3-phosphatase KNAG_0I02210 [Huiozyma naganishii CBS 8797]|uniref:phosphatidylinositol-3,4,5-trisphosphate 3-phosphatase n=1 Tax=Huiozyma naganishii (strain ATCC MYA-139 / BCRC 22969 / CBS 8797 / KCTC 17520 / NBRC 10181 / NCYC 3082 / Yp74L-3) TaxID=1071383 RepID=J7S2G9_HUIN7|nr:hypothetical protein KNAG_0I02210 [Kazachstania naganishii CBS 8797]CCK72007.1 hypothetical protein KNAG_0I02210 [Kazachstania naganishii CBS 8797]